MLVGDSWSGNLAISLALERNLPINITPLIARCLGVCFVTDTDSFKELGNDYFPQTETIKKVADF